MTSQAVAEISNNSIEDLQKLFPLEDERMYRKLVEYKERWGDCHLPAGDSRRDRALRKQLGISEELTEWVSNQRKRYNDMKKGKIKKELEKHKILYLGTMLESIGFIWSERDSRWYRWFNKLVQYKEQHNTFYVEKKRDQKLWSWAASQRKIYHKGTLQESRVNLLKQVGFVFDLQEAAWWKFYEQLCNYAKEHGSPDVPTQSKDDPSLGGWVARQRRQYISGELSKDRIEALESIGFKWDVHEERWDQFYKDLVAFHAENGHTRVPVSVGPLWYWVERQRRQLRQQASEDQQNNSQIDDTDKIAALNDINFDWSVAADEERAKRLMELTFSVAVQEERWVEQYKKLCTFKERFGHFVVPPTDPKYQELASWVKNQRFSFKHQRLSPERIAALDDIGFAWTGQAARWDRLYQQLVKFRAEHGHTRVPTKYRELYRWISQQRKELRDMENKLNKNPDSQPDPRLLALEQILDDE